MRITFNAVYFSMISFSVDLELMKKQILQPPANTTELLKRNSYLEQARNEPLNQLIAKVCKLKSQFIELTDIVTYTENDVIKSSLIFCGPSQIVPMLDTSLEVHLFLIHFSFNLFHWFYPITVDGGAP